MLQYCCIHSHFYQPARENPWTGAVDAETDAAPYHDWNERILAECYEPNTRAKILDPNGHIRKVVNTYAKTSFNIGPTLFSWLKRHAPKIYAAILAADKHSQETCSGHGNAIAQAYHHVILPLANSRDKRTQIVWGIRDFEHRFGRKPEGLWLPETAVDLESLDIASAYGIRFTILAPHQAKDKIDPREAYAVALPSGRHMALFFYDAMIASAIAFGRLLDNGDRFTDRLQHAFSADRNRHELVHIATDGETYGHHHRFGEMALAYALDQIETKTTVRLTNYGEYLAQYPPRQHVEIVENTSWSCVHGIERWRSDCGCNSGAHPDWTQAWRGPLRSALDWLRDSIIPLYEQRAGELFIDPWHARDHYIDILFNREPTALTQFFEAQAKQMPSPDEQALLLSLLELQRFTMLMYTSCGWFFDDISERSTQIVLANAARALEMAVQLFPHHDFSPFSTQLDAAKSNINPHYSGRWYLESRGSDTAPD